MDIGIIAEETNDVEVMYEFTKKIIDENRFSFKKFIAHGCGKLRRKCCAWSQNLFKRGCKHIIIMHDLDNYSEKKLRKELETCIANIDFAESVVLIPVHELEAWLLVDSKAIKKAFNMQKEPKLPVHPERVTNAKEKLESIIWKYSKKRYFNTIHNKKIAKETGVAKVKKACPSFLIYPKFLKAIYG